MDELRLKMTFDRLCLLVKVMQRRLNTQPATELEHILHGVVRVSYLRLRKRLVDERPRYIVQLQPHETLAIRRVLMWSLDDLDTNVWELNELHMLTDHIDQTLPVSAKK